MKSFYFALANTLATSLANILSWFGLTYWIYLETKSVMATSIMAGIFLVAIAGSGFFLGSIVDRYKKKTAMLISTVTTLSLYGLALLTYIAGLHNKAIELENPLLWVFVIFILSGSTAGNIRGIAISTLVTIMVEEKERDKANGLVGIVNGIAFLIGATLSGFAIGMIGMFGTLLTSTILTVFILLHLLTINIDEKGIIKTGTDETRKIDVKGTIKAIKVIPGLLALIIFHSFNNFLGGVYMSLMDAYGLELVSVEVWGVLWGALSLAFILGGIIVAKKGLGKNPLRTLFLSLLAMWTITLIFPIQASIVLVGIGMFIYLCLVPVVEASEQTIIQKAVPPERQGRVFGFAQSVEQAASPVTSFVIGPIAQYVFIPFMTDGKGSELIGDWFGTGPDRGIALLFMLSGIIGLVVTLVAMKSKQYKNLSKIYE